MAFELRISTLSEFLTFVKVVKGESPDDIEIQHLTKSLDNTITTLQDAVDSNKEEKEDGKSSS